MRRWERAATATLASLALVGSIPAGPAWAAAEEDPLEHAEKAAQRVSFSAEVSVWWVDHAGEYRTHMEVRNSGDQVLMGGRYQLELTEAGPRLRLDDWSRMRDKRRRVATEPALGRKYRMHTMPGPVVAGRPTRLVELVAGDQVRERLSVDQHTGLVLRREVLGPLGEPLRVVTVERLEMGAPAPSPGRPARAHVPPPVAPEALPPPYRAPAALAGGYERVGAYRLDRHVHWIYSDGLHNLSLFVWHGDLSGLAMQGSGDPVRVRRGEGLRYGLPAGEVVVWRAGPVVRLVVADAPVDEVLAAARSLPDPRPLSWTARLRQACRRVAEVLSGGP